MSYELPCFHTSKVSIHSPQLEKGFEQPLYNEIKKEILKYSLSIHRHCSYVDNLFFIIWKYDL